MSSGDFQSNRNLYLPKAGMDTIVMKWDQDLWKSVKTSVQELYPNLLSKWEVIASQSGVEYDESHVLPTPWHEQQVQLAKDVCGMSGATGSQSLVPLPIIRKRAHSNSEKSGSDSDIPAVKRRHGKAVDRS
jgi:hypothetical protein